MDSLLYMWLSASAASQRTRRARQYCIINIILVAAVLIGHSTPAIAEMTTQTIETSLTAEQKIDAAKQAVAEAEELHGEGHIETVPSLSDLARLYFDRAHYTEFIALAGRVLAIEERTYNPDNPDYVEISGTLFGLAQAHEKLLRFDKAEPLYQRSHTILEKHLGPEHLYIAAVLFTLANLYVDQSRYAEAEPLFLRALAINEKAYGPEHPDVALTLAMLAYVYHQQARYAEAEPLYLRLLAIQEKAFGPEHSRVAISLNKLAYNYYSQARFAEAEPLYLRSLAIREKAYGPEHPKVATGLNHLAGLYRAQARYAEAEPLYLRALAIREKAFGPEHTDVATSLNNLAGLYRAQARYAEAEPLYLRALVIDEKAFGQEHRALATTLNNLASLYHDQARYAEAQPLLLKSLAIRKKAFGPEHPEVAISLNNLALHYKNRARYAEAEPLYLKALAILEKTLGPEHTHVATSLNNLTTLYVDQARYAEAEPLYLRALAIFEKALGPEHPHVALTLNNLALNYYSQARFAEAESIYNRSLSILEKDLGSEHTSVALTLNNLAINYYSQARYADAEHLYLRVINIWKKSFGLEHPIVAKALDNLAGVYHAQARYAEAGPLYLRALDIKEKAFGPEHTDVATSLSNLAFFYSDQSRYSESYDYSVRSYGLLRTRFSTSGYLESAGGRSELASNSRSFLSHVSLALHPEVPGDRVALNAEAFEALQLTRSSSAGRAAQQMALRFAAKDDAVAKIVRRQQDLQSQHAKLEAKLIEAMSEADQDAAGTVRLRERQSEVSKELKAVNQQIKEDFPRYAELMRREPLSVSEVQGLLGKQEALLTLTPSWNEKQTHIFLLSRSGLKVQTVDLSFDDMDTLVSTVRAGLELTSGRLPEFSFEASHELYQRLFSDLEDDLKRHKHILYVPAAGMESIPLSVLTTRAPTSKTTNANAAWLTKTHAVTRLPTIGSLKAARLFAGPSAGADPLKGFGDPVLNGDGNSLRGLKIVKLYKGQTANTDAVRALPALPETTTELKQIAQLLGANDNDLYLREAATETAVKTNDLSSSRVIAFATHGLVAGDLKHLAEPALVLTPPQKGTPEDDGLLTASEITQLKLDADWIILSACNTAAADTPGAGGLSGLARAFVYAGARSLLVSHWPVETNAAHRLTTGLFDALKANDNTTKAEALRQSMLALANTKGFEHPALWAPFSVVGASSR